MKKILILSLVAILFTSCNQKCECEKQKKSIDSLKVEIEKLNEKADFIEEDVNGQLKDMRDIDRRIINLL